MMSWLMRRRLAKKRRKQAAILESEIERSGFFRITPGQVAHVKSLNDQGGIGMQKDA